MTDRNIGGGVLSGEMLQKCCNITVKVRIVRVQAGLGRGEGGVYLSY
jgi:hypothetical protein